MKSFNESRHALIDYAFRHLASNDYSINNGEFCTRYGAAVILDVE
jgi:hypothetical protein